MHYIKDQKTNTYSIRIPRGEELYAALNSFCMEHNITRKIDTAVGLKILDLGQKT